MGISNAGRDIICKMIAGEGTHDFNNANAYLGVGDSSTAFAASQTDLQAATNKLRKAMSAGYPLAVSSNVITWRAQFETGEANWAWNEWAIFNASSGGTMLNRKVESLGTKTSSDVWQLTVTLTITVPAS